MRTSAYVVIGDSQDKTYCDVRRQDSKRRRPSWSCPAIPKRPTTHHLASACGRFDIPSGSAAPDNFAVSDQATLPAHVAHASVFETCLGNIVAPFLEDDDASPTNDESTLAKRYDSTLLTSMASLNSPANQFIARSLHSRVDMKSLRIKPPVVASSSSDGPSHPYPYPHHLSTSYRAPERVLDYNCCMRLAGMREVRRYLPRISRNKPLVMHLVARPISLMLKTLCIPWYQSRRPALSMF
jgi:hypothetical protein